jgi:hypothetical protein
LIHDGPNSRDLFEDVCGFVGPDEGVGILIVTVDVFCLGHDADSGRVRPDAPDAGFGNARFPCHDAARPVPGIGRLAA